MPELGGKSATIVRTVAAVVLGSTIAFPNPAAAQGRSEDPLVRFEHSLRVERVATSGGCTTAYLVAAGAPASLAVPSQPYPLRQEGYDVEASYGGGQAVPGQDVLNKANGCANGAGKALAGYPRDGRMGVWHGLHPANPLPNPDAAPNVVSDWKGTPMRWGANATTLRFTVRSAAGLGAVAFRVRALVGCGRKCTLPADSTNAVVVKF